MQRSTTIRTRLSAAQRERVLQAYHRSGLSQRDFARQARIGLSTLQLWLRKAAAAPPESGGSFIEVSNLLARAGSRAPYRLHLPGEVSLEIGQGFEPQELASLLGLLRSLCSR